MPVAQYGIKNVKTPLYYVLTVDTVHFIMSVNRQPSIQSKAYSA